MTEVRISVELLADMLREGTMAHYLVEKGIPDEAQLEDVALEWLQPDMKASTVVLFFSGVPPTRGCDRCPQGLALREYDCQWPDCSEEHVPCELSVTIRDLRDAKSAGHMSFERVPELDSVDLPGQVIKCNFEVKS